MTRSIDFYEYSQIGPPFCLRLHLITVQVWMHSMWCTKFLSICNKRPHDRFRRLIILSILVHCIYLAYKINMSGAVQGCNPKLFSSCSGSGWGWNGATAEPELLQHHVGEVKVLRISRPITAFRLRGQSHPINRWGQSFHQTGVQYYQRDRFSNPIKTINRKNSLLTNLCWQTQNKWNANKL